MDDSILRNVICIRLLCTLEGKFLIQENCADVRGGGDSSIDHEEIQSLSFSCDVPNIVGRGFIEVGTFLPLVCLCIYMCCLLI